VKFSIWMRLSIVSFAFGLALDASAGERLVLATGQRQAPAYAAGIGIASLIKVELGPIHKIDLQAITSPGPVDNVHSIREGSADLAILPSVTGHAARASIGSFIGHPPEHQLRAITTLWRDALHLVVREDDASSGTIEDFLRLKGRKVFLGNEATGSIDANHLLITEFGLDAEKTFDISPLPDGDIASAIKKGNLDAFSIMSNLPNPMFQGLSEAEAKGLTFLDFTSDQVNAANGSHWLWTPYTIPAATYPGQANDVSTIAHSTLLVTRADMAEETVYLIAKSIFENLPYLHRVHPLLSSLTADQALFGMSLPLHPGALRYFKERGFVPDTSRPKAPVGDDQPSDRDAKGYPNGNVAGRERKKRGDPMALDTAREKVVGHTSPPSARKSDGGEIPGRRRLIVNQDHRFPGCHERRSPTGKVDDVFKSVFQSYRVMQPINPTMS